MKALKQYVIPISGLKIGVHAFEYVVDWRFFEQFEDSLVKQGHFDVKVLFDKQHDHWVVTFDIQGSLDTECDRCLAPISLPVGNVNTVIVKYDEGDESTSETEDIIYVTRDTHTWNIANLIHEFILLSVPIKRVYDCENESTRPCDMKMLKRLTGEEETGRDNPTWNLLKQIDLNN
jgi:uncharacterized metal-binding protein YceD (DUF177 family)